METDFLALLEAATASLVEDRLYPVTFAQATGDPCIRYQKVADVIGVHMLGSDGLSQAVMQVDIRGTTAVSVMAVRDAVLTLHTYRGVQGGTDFRLIELGSDRGITFDTSEAEKFYLESIDFNVFSRVAA